MKTCSKYLMAIVLVASCALQCAAESNPIDTVYIYNSWEQMLYREPMAMLVNPEIVAYSPFSVNILTDNEDVINQVNEEGHAAISIGDSIWLANSDYIKQDFKGDVRGFVGYVPLFFTEKVAYLTYPAELSVKEIIFGEDVSEDARRVDYYNIDFEKMTVKKVTHKHLSDLLEDYHDLQMRYEGMKDYKKNEIIEYFYFQYLERATGDIFKPYIVDLVDY